EKQQDEEMATERKDDSMDAKHIENDSEIEDEDGEVIKSCVGGEIEEESEDNEEEDEVCLTDENQSTIEEDDAGSFLIVRLENELGETLVAGSPEDNCP